ncbi:glycosyltransferase [Pseudofrankia sp. DC12]|uniref:glycosyltransferase n=1 Tax=Pseudofrankia sp. DC12 TaxID=683315 RepID=UPI0005F81302|nr:glycosyltransferase [Pseudofrankia sp. DC12]
MGASLEPPAARVVAVVTSAVTGPGPGRSAWVPAQRPPSAGGQAVDLPVAVVGQRHPLERVVVVPVAGPSPAAAIVQALRSQTLPDRGFVWLLDESSRPAPDALDRLLACAALDPGAAVLGPTGVTVDRSGRRRSAPGEPLAVRDVLAVNRVGALVRASAWRLLDGPNPLAGRADDLDLCWRAWRAGLRVVAVPSARMLPAQVGEPDAGTAGRVARTDALRVRVAQSGFWDTPAVVGSVVLAGLARTALALGRGRLRAAAVEALVLAGALADPARLWGLRRRSAPLRRVPARALRGLLPRLARPGLAPRPARAAAPATDRARHAFPSVQPPVLLAVLLTAAGCVLTDLGRDGGRPAPLPRAAAQLWSAVWSGWLGPAGGLLGGPGPAPPWAPMLALMSSALGGRPELAARVLVAATTVLAGLVACRAAQTLGGLAARPWARAGLAACYALAPPVTAAARAGSLAAVGACVAAPVLLAAAVRALAPAESRLGLPVSAGTEPGPAGTGWRSWWALAGALLLGDACTPGLLPVAAVGLVAAVIAVRRRAEPAGPWRDRSSTGEPGRPRLGTRGLMGRVGVVLLVGCAPLLPALATAARGGPLGVLSVLLDEPSRAGVDAPAVGVFAAVCAFAAALGGRAVRAGVVVCWLVAAAGWVTGQDALAAAGMLAGVGLAWSARLDRARPRPAPGPRGRRAWPRGAVALLLSTVLAAGPILLFVRASGWLGRTPEPVSWGGSDGLGAPTSGGAAGDGSTAAADPSAAARTLVLRPSAGGVTYTLTSGPGPTLIDSAGDPSRPARAFLASVVADLSVGGGWAASALPALGVDEIWLPTGTGADQPPANGATAGAAPRDAAGFAQEVGGRTTFTAGGLVAALDATDGLERDQPRPDGYYWRLGPMAGPVAELRLLAPGPAAGAEVVAGREARAGTARTAVAHRAATGPGTALAGLTRAPDGMSVDARVPRGPAGRLLVLAEPADPGWRATLAGRGLVPVTAWGWAQAFVVPAGSAGEVRVRYDHTEHRAWVLAEAAVAAAFLLSAPVLALAGRGRREATGPGAAR